MAILHGKQGLLCNKMHFLNLLEGPGINKNEWHQFMYEVQSNAAIL